MRRRVSASDDHGPQVNVNVTKDACAAFQSCSRAPLVLGTGQRRQATIYAAGLNNTRGPNYTGPVCCAVNSSMDWATMRCSRRACHDTTPRGAVPTKRLSAPTRPCLSLYFLSSLSKFPPFASQYPRRGSNNATRGRAPASSIRLMQHSQSEAYDLMGYPTSRATNRHLRDQATFSCPASAALPLVACCMHLCASLVSCAKSKKVRIDRHCENASNARVFIVLGTPGQAHRTTPAKHHLLPVNPQLDEDC
jgi:hypothetical protein